MNENTRYLERALDLARQELVHTKKQADQFRNQRDDAYRECDLLQAGYDRVRAERDTARAECDKLEQHHEYTVRAHIMQHLAPEYE